MAHTHNTSLGRHRKIRAVLDLRAMRGLTPEQVVYLRTLGFVPQIAGGSEGHEDDTGNGSTGEGSGTGGNGDGEGAGTSSGSSEGGTGEGTESGTSSGTSGSGTGSGKNGEGDGDDDADGVKLPRSEVQRLRRIAREADDAKKAAQQAKDEADRKKKRDEGRWQELLQEEQNKTKKAETERDQARNELTTFKRMNLVQKVASRLGFKDPADAHLFISAEDMDDEKDAETALRRVARQKDYLVNPRKASGGPGSANGTGGLTMDDIKAMSQEEINRRWADVQKVMAASGSNN